MNVLVDPVDRTSSFKCGGHCCKAFWIGRTLAEMEEQYKRWQETGTSTMMHIETIYPMLVPLELVEGGGRYTCKHHDAKTGLCTIYDRRPSMCSEYPYGGTCGFHACRSHSFIRRWRITRPLWKAWHEWKEKRRYSKERKTLGDLKVQLDEWKAKEPGKPLYTVDEAHLYDAATEGNKIASYVKEDGEWKETKP